jgi:hypothetical protein
MVVQLLYGIPCTCFSAHTLWDSYEEQQKIHTENHKELCHLHWLLFTYCAADNSILWTAYRYFFIFNTCMYVEIRNTLLNSLCTLSTTIQRVLFALHFILSLHLSLYSSKCCFMVTLITNPLYC